MERWKFCGLIGFVSNGSGKEFYIYFFGIVLVWLLIVVFILYWVIYVFVVILYLIISGMCIGISSFVVGSSGGISISIRFCLYIWI